ncbi:MAG: TSUP family transporter, partial [Sulfurimonadaceae bacterium]|nr:TSUP family transporter [Sulfurimonadaceae bacterium]
MIFELALIGIGVGVLSGFFGIGGGTILVPALLLMGFDMKTAIGISIVQMVFASVYGSYLNSKKGTLDIK